MRASATSFSRSFVLLNVCTCAGLKTVLLLTTKFTLGAEIALQDFRDRTRDTPWRLLHS
jgi:hypothetical protein